jgi:hypothetical protein
VALFTNMENAGLVTRRLKVQMKKAEKTGVMARQKFRTWCSSVPRIASSNPQAPPPRWALIFDSITAFGTAPTMASTARPLLKSIIVGIPCT